MRTSWLNDFPPRLAFEQCNRVTSTRTERKRADRGGAVIVFGEALEDGAEAGGTKSGKEVFDVRSGKAVQGIEAEGDVFRNDRTIYL